MQGAHSAAACRSGAYFFFFFSFPLPKVTVNGSPFLPAVPDFLLPACFVLSGALLLLAGGFGFGSVCLGGGGLCGFSNFFARQEFGFPSLRRLVSSSLARVLSRFRFSCAAARCAALRLSSPAR